MDTLKTHARRRGQPEPRAKGRPALGQFDSADEQEESKGSPLDLDSESELYVPPGEQVEMVEEDVVSKSSHVPPEIMDSVIVLTNNFELTYKEVKQDPQMKQAPLSQLDPA